MRGDPAIGLDDLALYLRAVRFATVALKGRIARLGPECRPALREIGRFQRMVAEYADAVRQTADLRAHDEPEEVHR
jgi:hypothetical protein